MAISITALAEGAAIIWAAGSGTCSSLGFGEGDRPSTIAVLANFGIRRGEFYGNVRVKYRNGGVGIAQKPWLSSLSDWQNGGQVMVHQHWIF
ncbi:MAG: hypothetical protein ACFE0I_07815 [Elainellaceae cyanobacterium]